MIKPSGPIVLDTNVVSELARPQPNEVVVEFLRAVSPRTFITTIVLAELYLGVEILAAGHRKRELRRHADAVRAAYHRRTVALTSEVAQNYARGVAEMRRRGRAISVNDAYIAAATVIIEGTLCTGNAYDFEHYPGLRVVDPFPG